jgi:hypothetical protein
MFDISKPKIWIKLNRRYKLRNLIWVNKSKNFDGKYLYEKEIYISKRKSSALTILFKLIKVVRLFLEFKVRIKII